MNELALFAGAGGGILGGKLLGWRTVCAVERDAYAAQVLAQRQNDGALEAFPIWSDVCSFDGGPWRGIVDVVSGGFPCQDISAAGKGAGIDGERSGMWGEMARIVGEVRPRFVFVENSPLLVGRGLTRVLGDLAKMGYDARWCVLGADDVGGQHQRKRIWIVANCNKRTFQPLEFCGEKNRKRRVSGFRRKNWINFLVDDDRKFSPAWRCEELGISPRSIMRGDFNGMAFSLDRIAAVGNGQVPEVAARAWEEMTGDDDGVGGAA